MNLYMAKHEVLHKNGHGQDEGSIRGILVFSPKNRVCDLTKTTMHGITMKKRFRSRVGHGHNETGSRASERHSL